MFLLWHIAVNTASLFLMTTPTNNILISVFKLFDPPVKRSKRKERPITDRMRGLDMYTETEMSATDGETDGGTDTEGDMPRERCVLKSYNIIRNVILTSRIASIEETVC